MLPVSSYYNQFARDYPHTKFKIYAGFFSALYSLVSAWIDPVTASKIRVLSSDFLDALREEIDDGDIPAMYGGSCQDFRCTSHSYHPLTVTCDNIHGRPSSSSHHFYSFYLSRCCLSGGDGPTARPQECLPTNWLHILLVWISYPIILTPPRLQWSS
jgi:hypothetical protein